jgi:hypothetical protein
VAAAVAQLWEQVSRHRFLRGVIARWMQQGRQIDHLPVNAEYYGDEPQDSRYERPGLPGVIGVADGQVVFIKNRSRHELAIDLADLRWIGSRMIIVHYGKASVSKMALVLHHERQPSYYVSVFVTDYGQPISLLNTISDLTGLTPHVLGADREDFGPTAAHYLTQDIYGQWQPAALDTFPPRSKPDPDITQRSVVAHLVGTLSNQKQGSGSERSGLDGQLYLAPDRLVYDGYTLIHLSQIRRIDLFEQGGLQKFNPFNEELLRIEYDQDGKHQAAGFLIRSGKVWAEALQARLNIPVEIHEGRKKKEG